MAFAVSDAHAAVRRHWRELSCEYLFYFAVRLQGIEPKCGVSMQAALGVVRNSGQPLEQAWPYLSSLPDNLENWQVPKIDSLIFKRNYELLQIATDQIFQYLELGMPVVVTFCLSEEFFSNWDGDGVIEESCPPNQALSHAVVAVGHMNIEAGKFVLIRNSWGMDWCINGYGWVSERHLRSALLGIAIMKEDLTNE